MNRTHSKEHRGRTLEATARGESSSFDPWLIWVAARRCWPWALPTGLAIAAVVALLLIRNFVPQYQAEHILGLSEDGIRELGFLAAPKDLARTEGVLIKNAIVTNRVLSDPECVKAPGLTDPETAERYLLTHIGVKSAGSSDRMKVTYIDSDPEMAMIVCNKLVESYLRYRETFETSKIAGLKAFLSPVIEDRKADVATKRRKVEELAEGTVLGLRNDPLANQSNDSMMGYVTDLKTQLIDWQVAADVAQAQLSQKMSDIEAKKDAFNAEVEELESSPLEVVAPTDLEVESVALKDPEVAEAQRLLNELRRISFNVRNTQRSDKIREAKAEEARAEQKFNKILATARETYREKITELKKQQALKLRQDSIELKKTTTESKIRELDAEIETDKIALQEMKSKISTFRTKVEEEMAKLEKLSGTNMELQFAQQELDVAEETLQKLIVRDDAIRMKRREAVMTFAPATVPRTPMEDLPWKQLFMFCLVAMAIPFGFAVLLEMQTRRLTDSQMCDSNGLAVIGEIARLPSNGQGSYRGRRVFEESVDALRSSLFLSKETRDTRSIAVVSSMSGEGKSSVASQMALSIAKATGQTVLIIDCDLRCPDQHDIFGLDLGPGVAEVLSGEATLDEAIDSSLGDLIHILPAGHLVTSPHRIINKESIQEIIDEALQDYACVIVDTAPVLSAGESLAVASAVDSVLLSVMRDVSRLDHVTRTQRRLEAAGANVVGTVFNGISATRYSYRYGDYAYAMKLDDRSLSG